MILRFCLYTIFLLALPSSLSAEIYSSSRVNSCEPTLEICGDGIDQDCNKLDPLCKGEDQDRDGYTSKYDCNDKDRNIHPGTYTACKAICKYGTKKCGDNGKYSFCTCKPLCQAAQGSKCYYINPSIGFDINDGSFKKTWVTVSNVNFYDEAKDKPKYWRGLKAGDVMYLLAGVHTGASIRGKEGNGIELKNLKGTKENPIIIRGYPGLKHTIDPLGKFPGIKISNSSYIIIEEVLVSGAEGDGILIEGSNNIKILRSTIRETDRNKGPNTYGVHIKNSEDITIENSKIYDNYDTIAEESGGVTSKHSVNIFIENSLGVMIEKNIIFQYKSINYNKTGSCLAIESSEFSSISKDSNSVIVKNNVFWNCKYNTIRVINTPTQIIYNFILNSTNLLAKDILPNAPVRISNNTIIGSNALKFTSFSNVLESGKLHFNNNVIIDNIIESANRPMISLINTGNNFKNFETNEKSKTLRKASNLIIDNNCYFNPEKLSLTFTSTNLEGYTSSEKKEFDFYLWKEFGYDKNSSFIEPNFSDDFNLLSLECDGAGWKNLLK